MRMDLLAIDGIQDVATLDLTRVVGRTAFVYTLDAHSASADLHEDDANTTHLRRRTCGLLLRRWPLGLLLGLLGLGLPLLLRRQATLVVGIAVHVIGGGARSLLRLLRRPIWLLRGHLLLPLHLR